MVTVQDIFVMRKQGQVMEAYNAILPLYKEHHGFYTTLCMFWTAADVTRLKIEAGDCHEAGLLFRALSRLYPSLDDKNLIAGHTLLRLALQLATKEQEQNQTEFSLTTFMATQGMSLLTEQDWKGTFYNDHAIPSLGARIVSRISREMRLLGRPTKDQLKQAMSFVEIGLSHKPHDEKFLKNQKTLARMAKFS